MAPFLASRTSSSFRVTTDKAAGSKLDAAKISLSWTKLINTISFCENNYLSIFLFKWICQSNNFSFQKKFFKVCFLDNFLNSCDKVSMKFIPFGLKFLESLFQNLNIQNIISFVGGGNLCVGGYLMLPFELFHFFFLSSQTCLWTLETSLVLFVICQLSL